MKLGGIPGAFGLFPLSQANVQRQVSLLHTGLLHALPLACLVQCVQCVQPGLSKRSFSALVTQAGLQTGFLCLSCTERNIFPTLTLEFNYQEHGPQRNTGAGKCTG